MDLIYWQMEVENFRIFSFPFPNEINPSPGTIKGEALHGAVWETGIFTEISASVLMEFALKMSISTNSIIHM